MKPTPHTHSAPAPFPPPLISRRYNPLPSFQHQLTYSLCNSNLAARTKPSPININSQAIADSPHRSRVANHDRSENVLGSGYKIKGLLFFLHFFFAFTLLYNASLCRIVCCWVLEGGSLFVWRSLNCEVGLSGLM